MKKTVLLYTGGTLGMSASHTISKLGAVALKKNFLKRAPELEAYGDCDVKIIMNQDSALFSPSQWTQVHAQIERFFESYDAVVLLHGTDTAAYTASALSYLLSSRSQMGPVVITGAQKPLASVRTDARRNLISAVEIATLGPSPLCDQVSLFFDQKLLRGNAATKVSALKFDAYESPYQEPLALVGSEIQYHNELAIKPGLGKFGKFKKANQAQFERNILTLKANPLGLQVKPKHDLGQVRGIFIEAYASGTLPLHDPNWELLLSEAQKKKIPVVISTLGGDPALYQAGAVAIQSGALWAGLMTYESALVKMSWLLGQGLRGKDFSNAWLVNYAGERA